mmetsp:Transcript_45544/g.126732  ORF Transcript_45544/g.126732 Transcript_45544/m.126732 type:complete len:209 (+) Transcript_45544:1968-2594(+)
MDVEPEGLALGVHEVSASEALPESLSARKALRIHSALRALRGSEANVVWPVGHVAIELPEPLQFPPQCDALRPTCTAAIALRMMAEQLDPCLHGGVLPWGREDIDDLHAQDDQDGEGHQVQQNGLGKLPADELKHPRTALGLDMVAAVLESPLVSALEEPCDGPDEEREAHRAGAKLDVHADDAPHAVHALPAHRQIVMGQTEGPRHI